MAFDLEEALARHPLPGELTDAVVNRGQLAVALGVSENMITRYLELGLPVVARGSNGQAYEFRLSEAYAWRMWDLAERQARVANATAAAQQMALLFRNDADAETEDGPVLTARQIAEEADADYRRSRAAELRGELVRRHLVEALIEKLLVLFRDSMTALPDWCEIECGLTAQHVEKLERRCGQSLTQTRIEVERMLRDRNGEVRQVAPEQAGLAI